MIDFLKCQECGTEKSEEVAFLEVHLPIRPFGSIKAYECIVRSIFPYAKCLILVKLNSLYFHLDRSFATSY